ncbi:MAG: alpha/beta hydrolase [Gemmatimonadaceae bacterium]
MAIYTGSTRRRGSAARIAIGIGATIALIVAVLGITRRGDVAPMKTTGTVTSDDGTAIAFTRLGHGPALVLVDGALCFRENGPSPDIAPLLAAHFTVYAYDRRGRGESGFTKPYAMAREIEDLHAVMRAAGDSAFVFGSSSGAALAMQGVAAGLPIRKLVLYEPPLGEPTPGGPSLDEARRKLEVLVASGDRAGAVRYFLTNMVGAPRAFVLVMPMLMPGTWAKTKSVAHTLPYDLAIIGDRSLLAERAKDIRVPTLVVGGGKSPEFLQRSVEHVAAALPNARSLVLPGQTHDVSAAGKALTPVLTDFFR